MEKPQRGGYRIGSGRTPLKNDEKKTGYKIYMNEKLHEEIETFGIGSTFSEKSMEIMISELSRRRFGNNPTVKFIDLFAGLGGIRIGFENAFSSRGYNTRCVLTSEIKPHAIAALKRNFSHEHLVGDIRFVDANDIPDFDFLLAGFPCQAFSSAGKGHGFLDTRGTLFFEIERILKIKKPYGFILENVEGLVLHDRAKLSDKVGRTLETILHSLEQLGYQVTWKLLDSQDFGVPQSRKRVYIVGTLDTSISLDGHKKNRIKLKEILDQNLPTINNKFSSLLFSHYSAQELFGKSIKDKRGGENNIHSWDIGLKGDIDLNQKQLLNKLLRERRKKHWAKDIGIEWMDGMPLTLNQIETFFYHPNLKKLLDDLVQKGYLTYEYPKSITKIPVGENKYKTERVPDANKPKGYNIVAGKLSFEFSKILDPNDIAPTLVAMDVSTLGIIDNGGLRRLSLREGLRLFGYPENYSLDFLDGDSSKIEKGFDLLGNTVTVPVIQEIASKLAKTYSQEEQIPFSEFSLTEIFR